MDVIGGMLQQIASGIMSKPEIQAAVAGLAVKVVVDQVKKLFANLDAESEKKYKVPVQLLVVICSALASLGDLYINGKISTYNTDTLVNFFMVSLPVYLNAMGIQMFANNVKNKIEEKKGGGPA